MFLNNKALIFLFILSSLSIVFLLLGTYFHFSPVPKLDMWDGYLDFYVKVMDGDWSKCFAQHNEHRTIFSNILFL